MQLNEIFHLVADAKESECLRELAARSGLSEGQIIVIAVSRMVHDVFRAGNEVDPPAQDLVDDIRLELAFERHGRRVGEITYLNAPDDFVQRVEQRIADGIPLPHTDDANLESTLYFRCLTDDQQAQARATTDCLDKRRLIAGFLKDPDS